MSERSNGKKSTAGTTLDLLGDDEPVKPRAARKAAPAPAPLTAPTPETQAGGALFGGGDVDLEARHPADVPLGNFPAPSQIAQATEPDPFGEEDPFEDSVMARMLADEPAPIASPLRAAREDFQEATPMTEAGPDLNAFADPVAAPEVEQVIDLPLAEVLDEPVAEVTLEPAIEALPESVAELMPEPQPEMLASPEPIPAPAKKAKAAPVSADKPTSGLTFERRYTEAGQDVWATTEWELRTASIVGSDGKVVFEQSGVEIPKAWSQLATNVVVSKYFRGQIGTLEREYSVKQLIGRVADRIVEWGHEGHYFASDADAEIYHDELRYILLHQFAAFNSPVWFNLGWAGRRQAVSACYITEVDDSMESILDLYKTEGMLFKDGSGSGHNLSPLRSSKEPLSAGGRSSGPIAFMKGLDASAGSIKSGGSTRRAAKMVILDADHPDIQEFVDCKKDAELKAHALIDAGYSGAFNVANGAYDTVPFQNANHSVRVTDQFMQAVEADGPWETKFRTNGETAETLRAKDLLHSIAEGTWVCGDPGMQFDTISNDWHTCANTDRIYASNPCSEFFFLNSTACNLSSLNLMKFREAGSGAFDTASFEHAVKIMITAQEMMVGFAHYPTEKITQRSHEYRPLGLGYANLGALLMAAGLPYDSDAGRAYAGAVTSLMTGRAYYQSAQVARDCGGPFAGYAHNREPMLRVMGKHRAAVDDIDTALIPETLLDAARTAWDETVMLGELYGYRNAQASVLAPTGTIGFMLDCDTTGIEPDIAIVKYKSLVGGGMMKIVNQTVPEALERLGYSEAERQSIIAFIDEHDTIEGATDLKPEHLPIFDCAFRPMNGTRSIHYRGHIKMMAAAQPFISGAISKCVTGDTLLATARGLVRIGSLYQNEKPDTFRPARLPLASLGGTRETDAFYYGGGKPTLGVTLRSGHRITGTPNHRLLVAREGRLDWVRLDEIEPGEAVATQYGTDLWADTAPRLSAVTMPLYGSEKRVCLPETMTEELAWLLGAYAAEGHTARSNWTVTLTRDKIDKHLRAVGAWQSEFGIKAVIVRQPGKCPGVKVSSKRIVLWMEALGCGARASAKRIPEAILQSPRPMVLSFLSGLMLDGYAVPQGTLARVAICLDAPLLLDDLQAILTNLGLVHSRITKKNTRNGKSYDEVYLTGTWAQQFARLVPFMEPDKAASAARLLTRTFAQSTADVVPGITPRELLALIPKGRSGHNGKGTSRGEFNFLADPRTKQVSRRTLERVAALSGVVLPEWLQIILRDNLRFSPVTEVKETGVQTVYDVSVPVTHAFVGNGIVNHNTVNLPNSATPDDIAETYMEAWKLGIKAVAVYRDGSKRTQPLNMGKETPAADKKVAAAEAETLIPAVPKAVRRRLPNERDGVTHKFSIGGHEGYLTVGLYPDTRQPGEIFIRMSKEGSSISGLMDSFATAISLALQYGVPLQTLVDKFIHSRFEPSGFTGNKEIPMAKSVMDYIFRYLALRFLQAEDRHNVGLLADQPAEDAYPAHDTNSGTLSSGNGSNGNGSGIKNGTGDLSHLADTRTATLTEHEREIYRAQSDAPPCPECGAITIRSGACYKCVSCGTSLGCS